ncbi:MAG: 50S ribosomal protein L32e [bacterium]
MTPDKKKESAAKKAGEKARAKAAAKKDTKEHKPAATDGKPEPKAESYKARAKPKLTADQSQALGLRREKQSKRPAFRRHEWWRYVKLGGKNAPWRVPSGIHSKVRRHFKYRPPVVSIGYRGPADVRGLHPSGFEEVLVYNPEQLAKIDKTTQAARIGGTVGGRKAKLIVEAADKAGIRVLNRGEN